MGKHVQWIAYKGKDILFMNAAGLAADEGIVAWEEMRQELLKERAVHLILVDATNARIERGPLEKAREVVGVDGDTSAFACMLLRHTGRGQRVAGM